MHNTTPMVIDCQSCPVRETHCGDCMVTALGRVQPLDVQPHDVHPHDVHPLDAPLLGSPTLLSEPGLPLDAAERRAVDVFVRAGLVDAGSTGSLRARGEPWGEVRAVG